MSNKVTLTGHFTLLDGTPAEGTVLIRPSRSPILDLAGKQVISGPQRFQLDAEGRFSVDLPPTDDPALGEPFTYHVMVSMHHTNWQVIGLTLPADAVSVDVLDPPAGVVKEYPTRAEWDAITGAAVSEMESALAGAESARDTTVSARDVTVVARDETVTARDETLTARDQAVDATGEAVTARDETLPARDETLVARDVTVEARDETLTARTETVEALTTALAGKVTGQGMTLRHDNSVGERVFLDHPGGTTMLYGDTGWRDMSGYLPPGVEGTFLARRTLHATDVELRVTFTADWQYIGSNSRALVDLIRDLPRSIFPTSGALVPTSLFMREGNAGGPTGGVSIFYQTSGVTRMRITTTLSGVWEAGTTIQISGTIPNDQPWPTSQHGTPL